MVRIAIVEDENEVADFLVECITRYEKESETDQTFFIEKFPSGIEFIENFKPNFDIIFMDIQMPEINGLDTAKYIYERDKSVCIIFVTNLTQYAINGYEVNALDYVLKPVTYNNIADKLNKALHRISNKTKDETIVLKENYAARIPIDEILYIEVSGHVLIYHTKMQKYELRGRIKDREDELRKFGFSRCNNCYLINLLHVRVINKDTVAVGDHELSISRGRMKEFLNDFLIYLSGEKI